ncbi:MAG: family 16 glycosylhydrolase [Clostridia bacterium]|nr:family 16 glycosylhydrolase [Clostridia bacterium]
MKNIKKILSVLTILSMVAIMFSVIPVQVSAAGGDVFTIDNVPDNWRYYTSSYVTRSSGSRFVVGGSTNKGNGLDNYGIMAANGLSTEVVKASTAYRIKFRIETWFALTALEVNIDTGTALWSRTNSVQRFTDLSSRSSNSSGGGSSKLYTDLTFDVTAPSTITGNQHFVIGIIPTSGNVGSTANLAFKDITITELMSVNVVNSADNQTLGTLHCLPGDDVETLLTKGGFVISGYSMVADIDTIAADTETVTVTYTVNPHNVQEIDFSETYGGGNPDWHYIPDGAYSDDGTGVAHVRISGGAVQHDSSKEKPTGNKIGQHSVTLANSFSNSGLEAGGTYRVTFTLKTFTQWTPLENLGAYIRFGANIWDGSMIDSAMIELSGDDLAAAVTSFTPASNGAVTFTLSLDVTLPESGWSSTTARNIILVVFGGQYWLDNVTISTTARFEVQDQYSNHLGYAYGLLGDKTADIVNGASLIAADESYTLSPATVTGYSDVITLTKSLKSNIVDKIDFTTNGASGYPGNSETGTGNYYSKDETNKKMIFTGSALKGNGVNVGNTFGFRSFVVSNNRADSGLEAGKTYRVAIKFSSWYQPSTFGLQVRFGAGVWNTISAGAATYTGDALLSKLVTERELGSQSGIYTLNLDVTLPEAAAWDGYGTNKNIIVSLYGLASNNIEYFLSKAYIYKASEIAVKSYDGTLNATAIGFEGETATEAFDAARNVKVTNFSETFAVNDKTVSAGNYKYIERGDANGNFATNDADIQKLRKYIIGTDTEIDAFGANANAGTFTDTTIDVIDMVRIKNILINPVATDPLAGIALNKSGYQLAWSYEFNDNNITDYFDTQYGMNRKYGDITTVGTGDKKYNRVENGALVLSPSDNYGAGNTLVSDAYTTKSKMRFTYGYMEICAKLAFSRADFPAIWLKSFGEPLYEIDVVETLGSSTTATCNLHYWKDDHDYSADSVLGRDATITDTSAFHKYGFEWYKEGGVSYIAFYVDGVHVKTLSKNNIGYNADFNQEMYLILENLPITAAVYNNIHDWAGAAQQATHADYPMDMLVDYVRLYQTTNNSGNTLAVS